MDSPERLQRRIATLGELHTIVRTMKALSAVSIRQYERAAQALNGYYRTVELGLQVVLADINNHTHVAQRASENKRLAAIVCGTDYGLCGRFNEDISAYALRHMEDSSASPKSRRILALGARAASELEQAGQSVEHNVQVPGSAARITTTVQQILRIIDTWRSDEDLHSVTLFFNRHIKGGGYEPTARQLFPIDLSTFHRTQTAAWPSRRLPTFTMDQQQLLSALLREYFFVSIFRACAESQASEHASRLAAMQSAEKNLTEKRDELTTQFRRVRQAAITTELLDVVSGFEAVTAGG